MCEIIAIEQGSQTCGPHVAHLMCTWRLCLHYNSSNNVQRHISRLCDQTLHFFQLMQIANSFFFKRWPLHSFEFETPCRERQRDRDRETERQSERDVRKRKCACACVCARARECVWGLVSEWLHIINLRKDLLTYFFRRIYRQQHGASFGRWSTGISMHKAWRGLQQRLHW